MSKVTPQEIFEVIEQQKKLQELRTRLVGVVDKVNQTINSITVENLELTSHQIEDFETEDDKIDRKPLMTDYNPAEQDRRAEEINQQIIDLELKLPNFGSETEEDDELDLCL